METPQRAAEPGKLTGQGLSLPRPDLIDVHCPYCEAPISGTRTGIGEATAGHIDQCEAAPEAIRGLLNGKADD